LFVCACGDGEFKNSWKAIKKPGGAFISNFFFDTAARAVCQSYQRTVPRDDHNAIERPILFALLDFGADLMVLSQNKLRPSCSIPTPQGPSRARRREFNDIFTCMSHGTVDLWSMHRVWDTYYQSPKQ
jgi:hypothetical protein